jgi:Asp-tRNA(Asn)/Glu-tRNA(Gln) amidotransferase A subunit family amidase
LSAITVNVSMARAAGAGARNTLTATEIVHAIAAGETTCEAVVRDCLDRIEQRESIIHAWAGIDPELVLRHARERDRSAARGAFRSA